jgi:hypothetical protein
MSDNIANLYQPIISSSKSNAPLVIRAIIDPPSYEMAGGVPSQTKKAENYVLISALPTELQEKVKLAIQMLIAAR